MGTRYFPDLNCIEGRQVWCENMNNKRSKTSNFPQDCHTMAPPDGGRERGIKNAPPPSSFLHDDVWLGKKEELKGRNCAMADLRKEEALMFDNRERGVGGESKCNFPTD